MKKLNHPLRTIRSLSICYLINVCGFIFALPLISSAFSFLSTTNSGLDIGIKLSSYLMILSLLISASLTFIVSEDIS